MEKNKRYYLIKADDAILDAILTFVVLTLWTLDQMTTFKIVQLLH